MKPENHNLSEHFTLYEYVEGAAMPDKAIEMNWKAWTPQLEQKALSNIETLESLRAWINTCYSSHNNNKPITLTITAGFRCLEWEKHQGRSGNSQHTICAFDIKASNCSRELSIKLHNAIYNYFDANKWMGGLAIKHATSGTGFIHLDFRTPTPEHVKRGYGERWVYA